MSKQVLEGVDVSHWNTLEKVLPYNPKFMMIKATEGLTFRDDKALEWRNTASALGVPYGFYHYARAEKNEAGKEADHFVKRVKELCAIGECVLALDFEGKALSIKDVDAWALAFMMRVYELTGVKPLLYVSQSVVPRFKSVAEFGCGLWVARYRNKMLGAGNVKPWKFVAMWQYTSSPIDRNMFYGSEKQFRKYGEVSTNV